jgi:hypothetical protein
MWLACPPMPSSLVPARGRSRKALYAKVRSHRLPLVSTKTSTKRPKRQCFEGAERPCRRSAWNADHRVNGERFQQAGGGDRGSARCEEALPIAGDERNDVACSGDGLVRARGHAFWEEARPCFAIAVLSYIADQTLRSPPSDRRRPRLVVVGEKGRGERRAAEPLRHRGRAGTGDIQLRQITDLVDADHDRRAIRRRLRACETPRRRAGDECTSAGQKDAKSHLFASRSVARGCDPIFLWHPGTVEVAGHSRSRPWPMTHPFAVFRL